jgi:hypothetical protein
MNDIVERLATARNMIELERAASDAIDEIEQLRAQVEAMKGYIHKAHERDGAEIERLREEILRLKNPAQQRIEGTDFDPLRVEIKRLKTWYRET